MFVVFMLTRAQCRLLVLVLGSVSSEGASVLIIESLRDDFFVDFLHSPSREEPGQIFCTPQIAVVT
jgi:hypothetical protein